MGDEVTCTRALEALHCARVVSPSDRAWLGLALTQAVGRPCHWEIPWASWMLRLCERVSSGEANPGTASGALGDARAREAAGAAAIAVTALNTREPGAPDAIARWSLAGRILRHLAAPSRRGNARRSRTTHGAARGGGGASLAGRIAPWLVGLGEYPAAAAPKNPPIPSDADRGAADASPGVREAVALWTAPGLIAGEDLAPWSRFGEAVAGPIGVLAALVHLWLDPGAGELRDAALTPLVSLWLGEPALRAPLLAAYAGERESPARRFMIHSLVSGAPFRGALSQGTGRAIASARAALTGTRLSAAGADFIDAIEERLRFFDTLMAFRARLSGAASDNGGKLAEAERAPLGEAELDLGMAAAFLRESAPWSGSWEVQRAGIFGSDEKPVGQWFVRGMILQALLDMGHDVRADAAALLHEIPAGELRYFGALRDIPPDADDLGLMLQLASATGAAADRAETWIAVMLANVDDEGIVPTWFLRNPAGSATTPSGLALGGADCTAVRLCLVTGLLSFGASRFDGLIQKNAARILERCRGADIEGVCYYDDAFTALAFLRFARLCRDKTIERSLASAIEAVEAAIRARGVASQRLDGGWGSPQRTAAWLEGAAMATPHPLLLERGARYLGEHQLVDGSWPAEPIYRTPMKRGRSGHHQGREISTALCARALKAAADALSRSSAARLPDPLRDGGEGGMPG